MDRVRREEVQDRALPRRLVFLIPFKPRSACIDWELAQANLRRTIRSVQHASKDTSLIVVACHDEPELADCESGVEVQRVSFPPPSDDVVEGGRDKARKRRFAAAWLRQAVGGDCYIMFLDADDLVHRDLPAYVLANERGSYLVDAGYILDASSGLLWRFRSGFDRICGSSFICAFREDELPSAWDDHSAPFAQFGARPDQRGHHEYADLAAELGRPSVRVPFPAVVYVANHQESRWGQRTGRQRRPTVARDLVWTRRGVRTLRDEFGAPDLAARTAALPYVTGIAARTEATRVAAAAIRRLPSR
jgi:hypothetical protein